MLLVALVALAAVPALTACDPNVNESGIQVDETGVISDVDQASRQVTDLMDTLKSPTDDTLGDVIAKLSNDQRLAIDLIRINGVDITDLCGQLFSDAHYEVGDVSVEGDDATVELRLDHASFGTVANTTNARFADLLASDEGEELESQGIPALLGRYEQMYLDDLQASGSTVSGTFSVRLAKHNGSWSVTSDSVREMAAKLVEGLDLQYGQ